MGQNKPVNFRLHVNNQKNYSFLFLSLHAITCLKNYRSEKIKNYRSEKIKNYRSEKLKIT